VPQIRVLMTVLQSSECLCFPQESLDYP